MAAWQIPRDLESSHLNTVLLERGSQLCGALIEQIARFTCLGTHVNPQLVARQPDVHQHAPQFGRIEM